MSLLGVLLIAGLAAAIILIVSGAVQSSRRRKANEGSGLIIGRAVKDGTRRKTRAGMERQGVGQASPRPDIAAVIRGCAALMEKTDPLAFYDEKSLPCPKDDAEKSLVDAMRLLPPSRGPALFAMLHWLAQFQAGVGEVPVTQLASDLGAKLAAQQAGTLSTRSLMEELAGMGDASRKARWAELDQRADSDRSRYRAMADEALAGQA